MSQPDTNARPDTERSEAVIEVEDLSVTYRMDDRPDVRAIRDISFEVEPGSTFGLVGESGCGKTTVARSLIDLLDDNGEITGGAIRKDGRDLTRVSDAEMRTVRWNEIATIPQNVMNSLNPVETVGSQVIDVIQLHSDRDEEAAHEHAERMFGRVDLNPSRMDDYPHEFSGGMLQRAVIAMAMSCDPDLIIADEPTTALDVVVQNEILRELAELQSEFDVAVLVISHDIGVMAEVCDEVGVMYAGEMMELGTAEDIFVEPSNPYTLGLKNSFPDIRSPDRELVSIPGTAPDLSAERQGCPFVERCPFAEPECQTTNPGMRRATGSPGHRSRCHFVDEVDRLRREGANPETWGGGVGVSEAAGGGGQPVFEVSDLEKYFDADRSLVDTLLGRSAEPVRAVDGVSFDVHEGEMFGIVGESGCGKSTLGRTLLDLEPATGGDVRFRGRPLEDTPSGEFRRAAQIIFQDPFESLNPRLTVRQTLMEPVSLLGSDRGYSERLQLVRETLADVGLAPPEEYFDRFPDQLSGGERQRVSIARALIVDPEFLLADEPVSMLDVSIRASILNILRRLRSEDGMTLSVISHDLSLVRNICDRTAVMYLGEIVELGATDAIVEDPKHPYTQALVDSVPVPDPTADTGSTDVQGEPPSAADPPPGCRFHTRCPEVIPPAEYEFDQERFREVMDLRMDLADDAVRLRADRLQDATAAAATLKQRRFSGGFIDVDAEAVVDDALELVARGDTEEAAALLAAEFRSPCERTSPEHTETEDGRLVACHLY